MQQQQNFTFLYPGDFIKKEKKTKPVKKQLRRQKQLDYIEAVYGTNTTIQRRGHI